MPVKTVRSENEGGPTTRTRRVDAEDADSAQACRMLSSACVNVLVAVNGAGSGAIVGAQFYAADSRVVARPKSAGIETSERVGIPRTTPCLISSNRDESFSETTVTYGCRRNS